jgi:hypothetical protein
MALVCYGAGEGRKVTLGWTSVGGFNGYVYLSPVG